MKTLKNLIVAFVLTTPLAQAQGLFAELDYYGPDHRLVKTEKVCLEEKFDAHGTASCHASGTKITLELLFRHCTDRLEYFQFDAFPYLGSLQLIIQAEAKTQFQDIKDLECATPGVSVQEIIVDDIYTLDEIELENGEFEPKVTIPSIHI